jgi:hypothetical protein
MPIRLTVKLHITSLNSHSASICNGTICSAPSMGESKRIHGGTWWLREVVELAVGGFEGRTGRSSPHDGDGVAFLPFSQHSFSPKKANTHPT